MLVARATPSSAQLVVPLCLSIVQHHLARQLLLSVSESSAVTGLVNEKTLHVEASEQGGISLTRSLHKHAQKPKQHKVKVNKKGKNFRRTAVRLGKEVEGVRPDLKVCSHHACTYSCQWQSARAQELHGATEGMYLSLGQISMLDCTSGWTCGKPDFACTGKLVP